LIVEYKQQGCRYLVHRDNRYSRKEPPLEQKILMGNGQYSCVLPLAQRYITLQMFLAGFYLTIQLLKITRGWEAEGLEEEAKVCFLSSSLFNCSRTTVTATWKLRGLP
jgi:hypothetical protein